MKWHSRLLAPAAFGTLLVAMSAGAATLPLGAETRPLQFTSGGHVVGFTPKDVVVATGNRALRVEFVGAQGVEPVAGGAGEANSVAAVPAAAGTAAGSATPGSAAAATADVAAAAAPASPIGKAAPLTRVTYPGLWDGITLAYDAPGGLLRSTYTVAPGADPSQIRLRYNAPVALEPGGELRIAFATGTMRESAPIAWQEKDGRRVPVSVAFRADSEREVGFAIGSYDKARPLIIDPTLSWNAFLGGSGSDHATGIALDGSGNIYLTGTSSASWGNPVAPFAGGAQRGAFVAKLSPSGVLQWNTFLGASSASESYSSGIAVDGGGNCYVTGFTYGTWGSPLRAYSGDYDAFVAKINASGVLQWNTFLGSSSWDIGYGIAADSSGNCFVTGESYGSWGSPIVPGSSSASAFVAKLNTSGDLQWNTFLGSSSGFLGIAVDDNGSSYVTGASNATWGSPVRAYSGGDDGFLAQLNASGVLQWNTFLGSSATDTGVGVAVDGSGNSYVTGQSFASWGSPVGSYSGAGDAFVARFDNSGTLQWNTFLGSASDEDLGWAIAIDDDGSSYVTGDSYDTWGNPLRLHSIYGPDALVAKLNSSGALQWNTFLGSGQDYGTGIAVDGSGGSYVAGTSWNTWGITGRDVRSMMEDAFVAAIPPDPGAWNTAPVAIDTAFNVLEEWRLYGILWDATDADGDWLTFSVVTMPVHGTLVLGVGLNEGTMTYVPSADYNGSDFFTYKANDSSSESNIATVSITVTPVNDAPVSTNDSYGVSKLGTLNPAVPGVLGNDTDKDGDPLAAVQVTGPAHGSLTLNAEGSFIYTHDGSATTSDSFTYMANDGTANSTVATVTITVTADVTPPTGTILINNGAASTNTTAVTLKLSATDPGGSGVASMRFRNRDTDPYGAWEPYQTTKAWALPNELGARKVFVQFIDRAGNISDANTAAAGVQGYMDAITLNEGIAPTGAIRINNGAASTITTAVTLNLTAADVGGSGLASMRFRNRDTDPYSAWEPYHATKPWTLIGGAGTKKVYVQFRDGAGNISDANPVAAGAQGYRDAIGLTP